jgi:hypothetical protein
MCPSFTHSIAAAQPRSDRRCIPCCTTKPFLLRNRPGLHQFATFPNVVGDRLLHIHMLAIGNARHRDQRVTVVRCRNRDGIDIGISAALAESPCKPSL